MKTSPRFSVSLMCMDFTKVAEQVTVLSQHADAFHLDIMDGHFAPNLALSPDFVKAIAPLATIPLEAHLMTERPDHWIDPLAEAGVDIISPHVETLNRDGFRLAAMISSRGCKLGLTVNPMTPLAEAEYLLPRASLLTLMTVDVGFAGQPFIREVLPKIIAAAELRDREGLDFTIQIDGACNKNTYKLLRDAGADMFILGNSGLFNQDADLTKAWQAMEKEYEAVTGETPRRRDV